MTRSHQDLPGLVGRALDSWGRTVRSIFTESLGATGLGWVLENFYTCKKSLPWISFTDYQV